MLLFDERSQEAELMDDLTLDESTMNSVLRDVTMANHYLGGNQITINAVDDYMRLTQSDHYTIIDVGCGDGDLLRELAKQMRRKQRSVTLIGVDIHQSTINVAIEKSKEFPEISYLCCDILDTDYSKLQCDVVISTLTMHHFLNSEIESFIRAFQKMASGEIIINDLQRSKLAYWLFKPFSAVFMRTKIARHDGLISIKRSFSNKDFVSYAKRLHLTDHTIEWKWAFRYLWRIKVA